MFVAEDLETMKLSDCIGERQPHTPTERRARDGQAIPEETGKTGSPAAILRSLSQARVVVSLFGRGLCEASSERLAASRGSRFSSL